VLVSTRTRMTAPIEYEYRFTEYEYEFDEINTGDHCSDFGRRRM
jgi:hypothetical protein